MGNDKIEIILIYFKELAFANSLFWTIHASAKCPQLFDKVVASFNMSRYNVFFLISMCLPMNYNKVIYFL